MASYSAAKVTISQNNTSVVCWVAAQITCFNADGSPGGSMRDDGSGRLHNDWDQWFGRHDRLHVLSELSQFADRHGEPRR